MRRLGLRRFAAVFLALALVSCGSAATAVPVASGNGTPATSGETYKIGFLASVTGSAATLGEPQGKAAEMVQQQINAAGGIVGPDGVSHPVEIIIEDTEGSADTAVSLVRKLVDDEGVVALIGSTTSTECMAMVPLAEEAKVPLLSMASSSAIVTPVAERFWVFKTAASNEHTAPVQVDYAKAIGVTKIANLYVNNAYGEDGAKAIRAAAEAAGIEIVYEDTFEAADTDMTAQITKAKASGAEAVLVTAIPPAAAVFTNQYRELGVSVPLIENHGIAMQSFIDLTGADNAEGIVFPMNKLVAYSALADDDPQKAVIAQFVTDYTAYAKSAPTHFAGHAYDALELVFKALATVPAGTSLADTRSQVRDQIEGTTGFVGIDGIFNFSAEDHVGLSVSDMVMARISDGKWHYFPREEWGK
jgi:branched-chain amino acid transport system substrate-binding protein